MALIGISGKIGSGKDLTGDIINFLTSYKTIVKEGYKTEQTLYQEWLDWSRIGVRDDEKPYLVKKFADELKNTICRWINCTREELEDRDFKEKELGEEWWYYKLGDKILPRGYYPNEEDNEICEDRYLVKPTPRLMLQLLGTEAGRNIIHPNIWVNTLFSNYTALSEGAWNGTVIDYTDAKFPNWIITDVRFPNEAEAIKARGGKLIRLHRDYVDRGGPEDPKIQHASEIALDYYQGFDMEIDNDGTIGGLIEKVKLTLKHFELL